MKTGEPLKIGLIGVGKMGQNHLRVLSLLNGVQLAFIHDTDRALASATSTKAGIPLSTNLEEDLSKVDTVVICSPTSTHFEYLRMAGRHMKKFFVEKPMTASLEESEKAVRYLRESGILVQEGFIERFNPVVAKLKQILDKSGEPVINIDFTRTNRLSGRISDVDVITDLMIHDIDLALHLNGPAINVAANGIMQDGLIAFATATLTHANGSFSRLMASRVTEKKMRTIQVTCGDKFLDCELLRKEILVSRQSAIRQDHDHYVVASLQEAVEVRQQEALLSELQAFVNFCRGSSSDVPTQESGLAAMRVCNQIQCSIRKSR